MTDLFSRYYEILFFFSEIPPAHKCFNSIPRLLKKAKEENSGKWRKRAQSVSHVPPFTMFYDPSFFNNFCCHPFFTALDPYTLHFNILILSFSFTYHRTFCLIRQTINLFFVFKDNQSILLEIWNNSLTNLRSNSTTSIKKTAQTSTLQTQNAFKIVGTRLQSYFLSVFEFKTFINKTISQSTTTQFTTFEKIIQDLNFSFHYCFNTFHPVVNMVNYTSSKNDDSN